MKFYDSDDELDGALFALALEEPPRDLRASILAATVYRQPIAVKAWEVWLTGAACALAAWLLIAVLTGTAAPALAQAGSYLNGGVAVLSSAQVLFWLGFGAAAAFWISQLNLTVAPEALPTTRR